MSRTLTIWVFLLALVGFGILEWLARRPGSRLPTLGDLSAAVLRYRAGPVPLGRIVVYALWCWVGWHFFAR